MAQGLTELTNHILEDARKQAEEEKTRSLEEAKRLAEDYRKETAKQIAFLQDDYRRRGQEESSRLISRAEMEAKLRLLANKQEMVHAAFERALTELIQMSLTEKAVLYQDLLLAAVEEGNETIAVSATETELWAKIISEVNQKLAQQGRTAKLNLRTEPADIKGGFLLFSSIYEVNASLEALIADLEERYYPEVAGILFE
ncbi:MAG TPA: hypothetical protein DDW93_03180 [Firmicutes bacterium]|jgi:vacuolar-type H+-ATPase subunit E/Vma4|nr:hypothetical protein [Bacillota bacterium]HBK67890.1 hypothetical protein [Bacillota bacterium]HBT17375.1 hypothetical protein [Bacillota bacterium]